MKNGRQLQEPRLTPPQAPPPVAAREEPKPVPRPSVVITANGIELANPTIVLDGHVFIDAAKQVNKLTPKRAVIAHGMIVIEELNLIVSAHGTVIRTETT